MPVVLILLILFLISGCIANRVLRTHAQIDGCLLSLGILFAFCVFNICFAPGAIEWLVFFPLTSAAGVLTALVLRLLSRKQTEEGPGLNASPD